MKKIIEKIFKVINIIANLVMMLLGLLNYVNYISGGYIYSDDITRVILLAGMCAIVNVTNYLIRKAIKEF